MSDVNIIDYSPVLSVIPNEGKEEEVKNSLSTISNMTVFLKNETIPYWHFRFFFLSRIVIRRNNRRITPIIGVADLGWSITTTSYFNTHQNNFKGGNHGYDNR